MSGSTEIWRYREDHIFCKCFPVWGIAFIIWCLQSVAGPVSQEDVSTWCRQKQLYVLAANYLQSLDFRQDGSIMKNIVQVRGCKVPWLSFQSSIRCICAQVLRDLTGQHVQLLSSVNSRFHCPICCDTDVHEGRRDATAGFVL